MRAIIWKKGTTLYEYDILNPLLEVLRRRMRSSPVEIAAPERWHSHLSVAA